MSQHGAWATPDPVAEACVEVLKRIGFFVGSEKVMDPGAGDGALIRALLKGGAPPEKIIGNEIEKDVCYGPRHNCSSSNKRQEEFMKSGARIENLDALSDEFLTTWQEQTDPATLRIFGNPPYPGNGGEKFVRRAKELSNKFAFLLPMSHLEPADCRWLDPGPEYKGKKEFFPDHLFGLSRVFPIRRVAYRDMTGQKEGVGAKPVGLFYWNMTQQGANRSPFIDYSLHEILIEVGYGK